MLSPGDEGEVDPSDRDVKLSMLPLLGGNNSGGTGEKWNCYNWRFFCFILDCSISWFIYISFILLVHLNSIQYLLSWPPITKDGQGQEMSFHRLFKYFPAIVTHCYKLIHGYIECYNTEEVKVKHGKWTGELGGVSKGTASTFYKCHSSSHITRIHIVIISLVSSDLAVTIGLGSELTKCILYRNTILFLRMSINKLQSNKRRIWLWFHYVWVDASDYPP